MKIALCISGFMRGFNSNFISLKQYLIDINPEIHIFINTWNYIDFDNFQGINENEIKNLYNPKKIVIEKPFQLPTHQLMIDKNPEKLRNINNVLSMFYKINKCNELKCEYEKENNFKYDCVIRFRSDINLTSRIIIDKSKLNNINIPMYGDFAGLNDQLAFSNSDNMNIYCNLYNRIVEYLTIENTYLCMKPELFLKFHIEHNNLKLNRPLINYDLIRLNGQILNNKTREIEYGYISV